MRRVIDCEHAGEVGGRGWILCRAGKFGGRPHRAVCISCLAGAKESKAVAPPKKSAWGCETCADKPTCPIWTRLSSCNRAKSLAGDRRYPCPKLHGA